MSHEFLTREQFSLTTQEDEQNYFYALESSPYSDIERQQLPPGKYTVVDGELFSVQPGVPPQL